MDFVSWQAFYQSSLQQVALLLPVPALWLVMLAFSDRFGGEAFPDARFLRLYAVVFCIETLLDPIATGPLTTALAPPEPVGTGLMFLFVLLGDFRVYLLFAVFTRSGGPTRGAFGEAALWTLLVPVFAGVAYASMGWLVEDLPGQVLWLTYEVGFATVAAWLLWRGLPIRIPDREDPRRRALSRVLSFVLTYYVLWAAADVLILFGGLDVGWLVRVVPNQLYYAFYVPFVCIVFWRR